MGRDDNEIEDGLEHLHTFQPGAQVAVSGLACYYYVLMVVRGVSRGAGFSTHALLTG